MTKNNSIPTNSSKIPKIVVLICRIIAFLSTKFLTLFIAKLFTTPIKHRIPKRELDMDQKSKQQLLLIPNINKKVVVYKYGNSPKKILLVHGWSGRGTQLFKIADALLQNGFSTISFDAPAHGKSPGNSTIMVDFIASILEIDKLFGPFEAAIGHSLGGMSVLNAVKQGLQLQHIVLIGSGDVVQDILDGFVAKLELKPKMSILLREHFEKKYNEDMNRFSAYLAAAKTEIPTLVIHDNQDYEVPVIAGMHIHKYLKNGELLLTEGLGHRKILGNTAVIQKITDFIGFGTI